MLQFVDQHVLGVAHAPLFIGLERHEQLDIGEWRGVAAIIRPAVLRNDGDDLRVAQQNLAHLVRRRLASFEPDGWRHRGADP